jgi:hypothetical protein
MMLGREFRAGGVEVVAIHVPGHTEAVEALEGLGWCQILECLRSHRCLHCSRIQSPACCSGAM